MKKTKKALATLAIAGMVMTSIPFNALADNAATTRIYGSDRIQTAINVAQAGWANGAATVIVAPAADANLVDALAAAPLAGQDNAPILLTAGSALDANTKQEIMNLKATKVIAVGALSDQVIADLQGISGVSVQQLKGSDRIDTASKIAAQLTAPAGTFVVGYGALADALSVASYAAANKYEILVANPDGSLPSSEVPAGTKYVIGGPTLVNDGAVVGATRIAGADRYDTNSKVIQQLGTKFDTVFVANGENAHLVDSLVASAFAAQTHSVIALTDNSTVQATNFLGQKMTDSSKTIALGGEGVVSETVRSSVKPGSVTPAPTGSITVSTSFTGAKSIATNQSLVDIGTVTLQAGSTDASITGIKVNRSGLSADTQISGISVWDGATRLNTPALVNNGVADITFLTPLNITAGSSKTLSIKADFNGTATAGAQYVFTLNDASSIKSTATVTGTFPVTSGTITAAQVTLGTMTVEKANDTPATGNVSPSATNVPMAKFNITAGDEDLSLKNITLTNNGSAGDTDIANLKLYNGTTQVGATATSLTNRKVTFIFPDGISIPKGTTIGLMLKGDLGNSIATRTFQFKVDDVTDVQSVGNTYGSTIVATAGGAGLLANVLTGNSGSLSVSLDASNIAAGTIANGAKSQAFETFKIQATGEPVQIQKIKVKVTPQQSGAGHVAAPTDITNLKLISDGVTLANVSTPFTVNTNASDVKEVPVVLTVTPDKPAVVTIQADVANTEDANDGFVFAIPADATAMTAIGQISGKNADFNNGADLQGNAELVGSLGITPTWGVVYGTDYASTNEVGHVAGTLTLHSNFNETSNVTTLDLDLANNASCRNMRVVDADGNLLTNIVTTPAATSNQMVFNTPLAVEKNKDVTLKVLVDITPNAAANPQLSNPVLTATGATTGSAVSELATVGTAQTVTIATAVANGNVTMVNSTLNSLDAGNIVSGKTGARVAAITVSNAAHEKALVKKVRLVGTFSGTNADLTNIKITDASGKTLGTVSSLKAAAAATDVTLDTPLEVPASGDGTVEMFVVGDVTSNHNSLTNTVQVEVGDGNPLANAVQGESSGSSVTTSAAATANTQTITASDLELSKVTIANTQPAPGGGVEIGRVSFTNNSTEAISVTKIQLQDILGNGVSWASRHIIDATFTMVSIDDGKVLATAAPLTFANAANSTATLATNTLDIDPGKTKTVSIILAGPGTGLVSGDATMLRVVDTGTVYQLKDGTHPNMSADSSVTLDAVSFKS